VLLSGDLLILERKFSWLAGVGIRIRRIPLKSAAPGALVDGPSIFEADLGEEVDNMEGIDAHVTAEGDTVLTMVSDDNFSMLQRTLLLAIQARRVTLRPSFQGGLGTVLAALSTTKPESTECTSFCAPSF